ncbi:MAG TPA: SEC-C domain-containing protein [Tahibacter sp.]|nr:SEC-C domain-containing protein [Tahibacter sp.]
MNSGFNFDFFVGGCLQLMLRSLDLSEYQLRYLQMERELFPPPPKGNLRDDDDLRRRLGLALARSVWQASPNPAFRFACPQLPSLQGSEPCYCGSGVTFAQCCEPLSRNVPLRDANLLGEVLRRLPRTKWKALPDSHVDVDRVAHFAGELQARGDDTAALALLEPWFVRDDAFVARRELLFDILTNVYFDLGKPRKKTQLLERAVRHGDGTLKSAALQRLASIASDRKDFAKAWALFREAEQIDPEAVSLSHLEVMLLLSQGREVEAKVAARRWIARLSRRNDRGLRPLIERLRELERDGKALLERFADGL